MFIRTSDNKIKLFNIQNFSYKLLWFQMYNINFINDDYDKIKNYLENTVIII